MFYYERLFTGRKVILSKNYKQRLEDVGSSLVGIIERHPDVNL
jgi:hypothetical protein